MATPIKYKPSQKVNIGVGKDTVNDFARKYNLEIEEIYDILNLRSARQVYFKSDSVHWHVVTGGYALTIPHNGNAVFGVYETNYSTGVSTMVPAANISMNDTNVTITASAPFDGFLMYAGLNDGAGMGSNLSDDVIGQLIEDTREYFDNYLEDAENFAESEDPFYKAGDTQHEIVHYSAKHFADAAENSYAAILAINTPEYLAQVLQILQEWTALVTDGIWEIDGFGSLMPKELPQLSNDLWEQDGNGDIEPIEETIESEGD